MVSRADILKQIEELKAQLPPECSSCCAPLEPGEPACSYCGRLVAEPYIAEDDFDPDNLPLEPPDIRKTNASDDPCPMCGLVHSIDPYAPVICRCQKCGQIAPVAISTFDPIFGAGVVCHTCCSGQAPTPAGQQSGFSPLPQSMPWQS